MCVACRAVNLKAPSRYFSPTCGSALIYQRLHAVTAEPIDVELWVNQIEPEDWDWYQRHWDEMDEFEYRVRLAVAAARQAVTA